MTRTQLQAMSVRDLSAHARRTAEPHFTDGDLILELAERLDDCYVFEAPDYANPSPDLVERMTRPDPILQDLTWKEAP
jgi:hypothetical protein